MDGFEQALQRKERKLHTLDKIEDVANEAKQRASLATDTGVLTIMLADIVLAFVRDGRAELDW